MITQELVTVDEGELYLESRPIAQHMLGFIQKRAKIDWDDLECFYTLHEHLLSSDDNEQIDKSGLVKFFIDPLIRHGFIEKYRGNGWRFVVSRE
jgi:hypothetical protein